MNAYSMTDWEVPGLEGETIRAAVNMAGNYIGDEDTAKWLCERRGIAPELADADHRVCSIGFCEQEQKWYGWSHRAIAGFGIGSEVKRGDCGYVPVDWDDFLQRSIDFWSGDESGHVNVAAERGADEEGREVAKVSWTYSDDVPNEKIRGQISGATMYPPETWGRGEWTAASLDDAKQMAIDFANGVS
jgi:hypothetical protein